MATIRLDPFLSSCCSSARKNKSRLPLAPTSSSLSSISFASLPLRPSIQFHHAKHPKLPHSQSPESIFPSSSLQWRSNRGRGVVFTFLSLVGEESVVTEEINGDKREEVLVGSEFKRQPTPCELYVCNLPRSCDIPQLQNIFKPFGTVLSVEVSKNPETGVSRGCGYVTMGSINSARKAIAALDGSDVGGREMRVRFSVDISSGRRNPQLLNSAPTKVFIYESPYKLYVGNLAWATSPEDLRNQFSQYGTVMSVRVLYDRKGGKNRAYGFVSYSSASERDAAMSLDGSEFNGRVLVVREGVGK